MPSLALKNKPLIFEHPSIDRKLTIPTGASQINWQYQLNTNVQSTYGGEVSQILSAYVGPLTITGQTRDNNQLDAIYEWFLEYMQIAGLHNRTERAIKFTYPERGWVFYIQVNKLPNFLRRFGQIGVPWMIQAEIVADNDINYLAAYSMNGITGGDQLFDPSMIDIGFRNRDPRNDPRGNDLSWANNLGNNFQSLLGSWATGDFHHWGFDILKDSSQNELKSTASDYFTQAFGTDFISGKPQNNSIGGTSTYLGNPNPMDMPSIVALIVSDFESRGTPGVLGVAVADLESGFNPNAPGTGRSPSAFVGLFQTNNNGRGKAFNDAALTRVANNPQDPVTKYYPSGMQIGDASRWFPSYKTGGNNPTDQDLWNWAVRAQLGSTSEIANNPLYEFNSFQGYLSRARSLVKQYGSMVGAGSASQTAIKAVQAALTQRGVPYRLGGEQKGIGFDCSGLCQWAYAQAGFTIPRTSETQWAASYPKVSPNNVVPGDLVYTNWGNEVSPGHVVMAIGGGKVIAAPSTGQVVKVDNLSTYLNPAPFGGVFVGINRPAPK